MSFSEDAFNNAVEFFIEKLAHLIEPEMWELIEFKIGETAANTLGCFNHFAFYSYSTGRKKFVRNNYDKPASITINAEALIKQRDITLNEILPHEMAHAAQFLLGENVGHQGNFKKLCNAMGINSSGRAVVYDGYEDARETFAELNKVNRITQYVIRHNDSGNEYTITKNLWTRMAKRSRVGKNGELVNQNTCTIMKEF